MSNIKYILGHFEDPDDLMHGIDKPVVQHPEVDHIRFQELASLPSLHLVLKTRKLYQLP